MNKKILRNYEEIAIRAGLRLDPEGGALYGERDGYQLTIFPQNANYPYRFTVLVSAQRPEGALTKDECKRISKEHKEILSIAQNGWQITAQLKPAATFSQAKLQDFVDSALTVLTSLLRGAGFRSCCQSCGTVGESDTCYVGGAYAHLCPSCYAARQQQTNEAAALAAGRSENIVGGIVGALLGSLVGVACIVLLSQMGYVAALSGVVMAVCTLKGYEKLGGTLSRRGVWISVILMLVMTFVGDRLDWAIVISRELEFDLFTSFQIIPMLLEEEIIPAGSYWGNLIMLYLFLLLGLVPTVRSSLQSRASASRIYRLEKNGSLQ